MLNGFWKLTWVETKIFVREPKGVVGTLGMPVLVFIVLSRIVDPARVEASQVQQAPFNVAVLAGLLIAVGAVI